jgi:hypothetical protein
VDFGDLEEIWMASADKSDWFRERAIDCAKLAAAANDGQVRAVLMHMADAWLRLADWRQTTDNPDRTPQPPQLREASNGTVLRRGHPA